MIHSYWVHITAHVHNWVHIIIAHVHTDYLDSSIAVFLFMNKAMRLIVLNSLYTIHTCSHHVLLTGTI